MSILGINYEDCNNCNLCLTTCILFRRDQEQDKIVFNDPTEFCNLCGQCIARCPQDAILYEGMGEAYSYEDVGKPEKIASYDPIYKFLRANRSIRRYRIRKVSKDTLQKVFDAMLNAPTAENARTENFTILSDKEQIKKLNDAVIEELMKQPRTRDKYGTLLNLLGKVFNSPIFFDAPHVIFVDSPDDSEMELMNIGIIITYGRLAAQALGLGTCWNGWTQMAMMNNPEIKKIANIKGKKVGIFILGHPAVKFYRSPPRAPKKIDGLE
ncbi:MAG: nitroreductase family protein [Candidatus Lokiarchaeota archaeon]|nr:nitroreductase family protein [Candidatus Lokiarchaeota archaeon]